MWIPRTAASCLHTDEDSGRCDCWTPEETTASPSGNCEATGARNADKNKGPGESLLPPKEIPACSSGSSATKHERNVDKNGHLPGTHWAEGAEGDSGCRDSLTSEVTPGPPSGCPDGIKNSALVRKCIAHKEIIIALAILVVVLFIAVIVLAVADKKTETYPSCPLLASQAVACPDFWVGYKGKCFYTSKEEGNWSLGIETCSSLNASLAVIDTQNELDYWVKLFHPFHYWFGLSREVNQTWKWSDGTEFKNQFPVRGEGFCAYLNGKGADSTLCSMEKLFLCSRPESCRING